MENSIFRWFGWARALFVPSRTSRRTCTRCAAGAVRTPAKPPEPDYTVVITAHGIDFVPRQENAR
ncbi:hypothetical protein [Streptomyces sp. NPDC001678]|uniref:hypothetical protein n=1 Tax=Streptomyces sp. NPDC001678 TaxID=3364599 RepID=UPI0036A4DDA0